MLFARWLSCIFMFAVTKTHRCSRGVDPFDSVETKDPVFSASRSLVIRRAQQPKRLVTLVSRPYICYCSLRASTFSRKTRPFTRKIARIGISTQVSGTPTSTHKQRRSIRLPPPAHIPHPLAAVSCPKPRRIWPRPFLPRGRGPI